MKKKIVFSEALLVKRSILNVPALHYYNGLIKSPNSDELFNKKNDGQASSLLN